MRGEDCCSSSWNFFLSREKERRERERERERLSLSSPCFIFSLHIYFFLNDFNFYKFQKKIKKNFNFLIEINLFDKIHDKIYL